MSSIGEVVTVVSAVATAVGVGFAGLQLRQQRWQTRTAFEETINQFFLEIIGAIPSDALLGRDLDDFDEHYAAIYRYLDLSNYQVHLANNGRLSAETRQLWGDGIRDLMSLPAFRRALFRVRAEADRFDELYTFIGRPTDGGEPGGTPRG
jgi:hypothetical protein